MPYDFQDQSQDQRRGIAEQLMDKLPRGEECELSFLIGAPQPKHQPETD
jgi:hypothetical protein